MKSLHLSKVAPVPGSRSSEHRARLGLGLAILALTALPGSLKGQFLSCKFRPLGLAVDASLSGNSDANSEFR